VEHRGASRQGIGSTTLTFQVRTLFLPRLRIHEPAIVFVRHGQKSLSWNGAQCVIAAEAGVAIAGDQVLDVVNRPSPEGIYEEVWVSGDREILAGYGRCDTLLAPPVHHLHRPPPELRAAFDRAVEAITAGNAVPYQVARHRMLELMRWAGCTPPKRLVSPTASN
jgi:hypothetical protein